jgi:hypothetical protein
MILDVVLLYALGLWFFADVRARVRYEARYRESPLMFLLGCPSRSLHYRSPEQEIILRGLANITFPDLQIVHGPITLTGFYLEGRVDFDEIRHGDEE